MTFIVDHQEMNKLAQLDLVLIACPNTLQLFLHHTHPAHPRKDIKVQLHDGQSALHIPV